MSIQSTEPAATEHNDRPLATEQVLIEEALAINPGDPLPEGLKKAARRAHGQHDQKLGVAGDEGDAHNCVETATELPQIPYFVDGRLMPVIDSVLPLSKASEVHVVWNRT